MGKPGGTGLEQGDPSVDVGALTSRIDAIKDNMSDMGGLRKSMPITFGTFVAGTLALAGIFPFAGFWSKDEILAGAFFSDVAYGKAIWFALVIGAGPIGAGAVAMLVEKDPKLLELRLEFAGSAIEALSMEGRMTVCNMAIEAGARAGMIGVDDTTLQYLEGRPYAPAGERWKQAVAAWRELNSDDDAGFDPRLCVGERSALDDLGDADAVREDAVGHLDDLGAADRIALRTHRAGGRRGVGRVDDVVHDRLAF